MSIAQIQKPDEKITGEEAEEAVRTLLRYIGEDPSRDDLRETPSRYIEAFNEFFAGYGHSAREELSKSLEEIDAYDDMIVVKDVDFVSYCKHHIVPMTGTAHIAYWPDKKLVGIGKLARIVDIYARRLTLQESLTRDIANVIDETLEPKGCAVFINANHQCMTTRSVNKTRSSMTTSFFTGIFKEDAALKQQFLNLVTTK